MLKTHFSGHSTILGATKNWGALPANASHGYGPVLRS